MNNQEQIRETLKKEKFPFDKLKNQISKEVFNSLNHKTPMGGYNVSIDDYEDILNQNWNMYNIGKVINRLFTISPFYLNITAQEYLEVLKTANEMVVIYNERYNELIPKEEEKVVQLQKDKSKFHK